METGVMLEDDEAARWAAVTARDSAADGLFVYAVRTTGVFCRPSCPSRPARRANVGFYADAAAARAHADARRLIAVTPVPAPAPVRTRRGSSRGRR